MSKYGVCSICGMELEAHGWVHERPSKNVNFFFLFKKLDRFHIKCQHKLMGVPSMEEKYGGN